MKFKAAVDVMPHEVLLDPQGKAVQSGLKNLGLAHIENVRVGKHITLYFDAETEEEARQHVDNACKKLLANPIMEFYTFELHGIDS